MKAWEAACSSKGTVYIVVPENRAYTLKPVKFSGPCISSMIVFKVWYKPMHVGSVFIV